jgi:hypothetical protein
MKINHEETKSAKLVYSGAATVNGKPAHAVTLINYRGVKIKMFFETTGISEEIHPAPEG